MSFNIYAYKLIDYLDIEKTDMLNAKKHRMSGEK